MYRAFAPGLKWYKMENKKEAVREGMRRVWFGNPFITFVRMKEGQSLSQLR